MSTTYTEETLQNLIDGDLAHARVKARFLQPFAGGQPATEKGLAAFVQHHLGIDPETDPDEFSRTVARIQNEEIGDQDTTPENGEVKEKSVYGVNVIRRGEAGAWVGAHQVKALIKQAASRLGVFTKKRGSKGDVAEMGLVAAVGDSLQCPDRPWEIYLRREGGAAATEFRKVSGSVSTASGKKSIQHHTECAEEGAEIEFELSWPSSKISKKDMALVMAATRRIGLGSMLSLEYGRFEIVEMEID